MIVKGYKSFFSFVITVHIFLTPGLSHAQDDLEADDYIVDGGVAGEGSVTEAESPIEPEQETDAGLEEEPAEPASVIPLTNEDVDTIQVIHDAYADNPNALLLEQREEHLVQYNPDLQTPLGILGKSIAAGERRQLKWIAGQSFSGRSVDVPVLVIRGVKPGPVLCLTAAIHGDELNGIEIVRRVMSNMEPEEISGTLIGVPIVNLMGFIRGSRYLPDRRDLNRYFPGRVNGSTASRVAYLFFEQVVKHCNRLVDFHTGSFKRTNMPQLRADLGEPSVLEFANHFGATAVLHKSKGRGTLRAAATDAGIPAVTFELGEPSTLNPEYVEFGVKAIETLIYKMWMIKRFRQWSEPQPVYYGSRWIRADRGGILITDTKIGKLVKEGDVLGRITNPLNNEQSEIKSPVNGRVLGMALNQFVLPGFASFHIGVAAKKPEAVINVISTFSPVVENEEYGTEIGSGEDAMGENPDEGMFNEAAGSGEAGFIDDEEYH